MVLPITQDCPGPVICQPPERRISEEDRRGSQRLCRRTPFGRYRIRVSGDAGEDIGKEKTETAPVEKKRYPEVL